MKSVAYSPPILILFILPILFQLFSSWRSWRLGGSTITRDTADLDVGAVEDGGVELHAEAGGFGDGDGAVYGGHRVVDQPGVFLEVMAADAFQDEEVRHV